MVMIKLVRKEDAKNVRNYFMFLKLANIVLNVLESSGSGGIIFSVGAFFGFARTVIIITIPETHRLMSRIME